jgi:hypothetical protein
VTATCSLAIVVSPLTNVTVKRAPKKPGWA